MRSKEIRFPLAVEWVGGRKVVARVSGKPEVELAPPPEFRGTSPDVWSPEDMFVATAASCVAVTLTGIAERQRLPLHRLELRAHGLTGTRPDGHYGFTKLELALELETDAGEEERARRLVEEAERRCLVTASMDVAVELTIDVQAAALV
jgi:organic hydroperoxide reductase OsmC/OhrA